MSDPKKVALVIIDGFGIAPNSHGNAITTAKMPFWDYLEKEFSVSILKASGNDVGLPKGVMGNSEVGHFTIGTGQITFQSLELINQAIENSTFSKNPVLKLIENHSRVYSSSIHLMGLLSDGGVHSHLQHLYQLIETLGAEPKNKLWIHAITDGRDTSPHSSVNFVQDLLNRIEKFNNVELATVIGRYFGMDRDKKWERTQIAYDMLTGTETYPECQIIEEIQKRYQMNETDEFLRPMVVNQKGLIKSNDSILFFNFRPDRARQLTLKLTGLEQDDGDDALHNIFFSSMTRYMDHWDFPVLFENLKIENCLAEVVSSAGLRQLHVAETEKYAHVTYFLNGGIEKPFEGEDRKLIPSSKVSTYDLLPEMSNDEITNVAINAIMENNYSLIVINYASADMVGHTGVIAATIKSLISIDSNLRRLYEACIEHNYVLVITSDHGNAEQMLDEDLPHTAHTTNDVPFVVTKKLNIRSLGGLRDVTPTILDLMNIRKPETMTGTSLIIK